MVTFSTNLSSATPYSSDSAHPLRYKSRMDCLDPGSSSLFTTHDHANHHSCIASDKQKPSRRLSYGLKIVMYRIF